MHKIAMVRSSPMVFEVMRRREDASTEAFTATESTVGDRYLCGLPSVSTGAKRAARRRQSEEGVGGATG